MTLQLFPRDQNGFRLNVLIVVVLSIGFFFSAPAWAAPNLSGIWQGQLILKKHVKFSAVNHDMQDQGDADFDTLMDELPGLDTMSDSSPPYFYKIKIYYDGNQARITNMGGNTPQSNPLIFLRYAQLVMTQNQTGSLPAPPAQIDLPLSESGIVVDDSASGMGRNGKYRYDITSRTSLAIDLPKQILTFKLDAVIKTERKKDNKIKRREFTINVNLPMKRDTKNPSVWTDEELTLLINGAEQHPFLPHASFNHHSPMANVAYHLFNDSKQGYEHLMAYALRQYRITPGYQWVLDVDTKEYGYYSNTLASYIGLLDGTLAIGKLSFNQSVLFLASAYVHEYTHYRQYKDGEWVSEKKDREQEAHCVQKDWLENHQNIVPSTSYSRGKVIKTLEGLYKSALNEDLVCGNGRFPRGRMRFRDGGRHTGGQQQGQPGQIKGGQEQPEKSGKWQIIVD